MGIESNRKKTCRNCGFFAVRFTGTGLIYLCDGIVLADEGERFSPRENCPRWIPQERKEEGEK